MLLLCRDFLYIYAHAIIIDRRVHTMKSILHLEYVCFYLETIMASVAIIRFLVLLLALVGGILLVVSCATHHWYVQEILHPDTNTTVHKYGGLFEDCIPHPDGSIYCQTTHGDGNYINLFEPNMQVKLF